MRSQSVSLLPFSPQCSGSHQICSVIVYSQINFAPRLGRWIRQQIPEQASQQNPESISCLCGHLVPQNEHYELRYRLAGSMNINTDAARRCREWSGADTENPG